MSDKPLAEQVNDLDKAVSILTILLGALGTWCVILTAALGGVLTLWGKR